MMSIMILTSCTLSLMFTMTSHPLSMGLILMMGTITIAMLTGLMTQNLWFSYILFMVLVGGMLVLFIYMTSVAANEKFLFSMKASMSTILIIPAFIIPLMDSFIPYQETFSKDSLKLDHPFNPFLLLNKYIEFPANAITISIIFYLLITLIAVVKITNIKYGPLRQGN